MLRGYPAAPKSIRRIGESKLNGLSGLPNGFLELIAGGVLDDYHCGVVRYYAKDFKNDGIPLECALSWWQTYSKDYVDPADQPECEDIIRSIYEP